MATVMITFVVTTAILTFFTTMLWLKVSDLEDKLTTLIQYVELLDKVNNKDPHINVP